MQPVYNQQGKRFWLDKNIGSGGEADVWTIDGYPDLVAKIYKNEKRTWQQEAKLRAMVANPPKIASTHTDIAWPVELLYEQNQFVGFLMPYLQGSTPIFNFYNPTTRNKKYPRLNQKSLYNIALNLTIAVGNLHAKGHVIGDVNESNILVNSETLVTIIDTDSFQISDQRGQIHHCQVGKPEFTPPELQGVDLKKINRTKNHDNFGLAVLIFQLLMEGFHPFSGKLNDQGSVERVDLHCIRQGIFPYQNKERVTPPPNAPSFKKLHPDVQVAFIRCFVDGHRNSNLRPTAKEWKKILQQAKKELSSSIQTIITPTKPKQREVKIPRKSSYSITVGNVLVIIIFVAILVIFVPAYSLYLNRATVSEALQVLARVKMEVDMFINETGQFPSLTELKLEETVTSNQYVANIISNPQEFYLQATIKNDDSIAVAGKTIRLTYEPYAPIYGWRCSAGYPNGVDDKYLPRPCRRN